MCNVMTARVGKNAVFEPIPSSLEGHDDFMKLRVPDPHPPSILELGAGFRERPRLQKRASERAFKGTQGESSRLFLSIDGFGYVGRSSSPTEEATILLRNVPHTKGKRFSSKLRHCVKIDPLTDNESSSHLCMTD